MPRQKLWTEDMGARFPAGTFKLIRKVLDKGEDRTDFVRVAVELELQRRLKERERQRELKRIEKEKQRNAGHM